MIRRMMVTGFACSKRPWLTLVPSDDPTTILTLADVLSQSERADLRTMAKVVDHFMDQFPCDHLIAHDLGVTTVTLAILARRKRGRPLPQLLTLFNGAFSGFDVFRAPHPIKAQFTSWQGISKILKQNGAVADPQLEELLPQVKRLYRQVIAASVAEKLSRQPVRPVALPIKVQIIEGIDDPFIPQLCMDRLQELYAGSTRLNSYVGHFPYTHYPEKIANLLREFEAKQL